MNNTNKHTVIRIDNLMYKGCEPHWKCIKCGNCTPFHCYTKEMIEEMECKTVIKNQKLDFKI